jgi:hypothetical protein
MKARRVKYVSGEHSEAMPQEQEAEVLPATQHRLLLHVCMFGVQQLSRRRTENVPSM